MLSRSCTGLAIYGPPGTGKSQTITNIIGDHLARAQRVLFVCDKRTALDVVMNRLQALGLGELCAIIHDPQQDQRELYRSIREQLESLTALRVDPGIDVKLSRVDEELTRLHGELTDAHRALMRAGEPGLRRSTRCTMILQSQGWKLHRLWTPSFFRDPECHMEGLVAQARAAAE